MSLVNVCADGRAENCHLVRFIASYTDKITSAPTLTGSVFCSSTANSGLNWRPFGWININLVRIVHVQPEHLGRLHRYFTSKTMYDGEKHSNLDQAGSLISPCLRVKL